MCLSRGLGDGLRERAFIVAGTLTSLRDGDYRRGDSRASDVSVWTLLAKHSVDAYTCKHTGCTHNASVRHTREMLIAYQDDASQADRQDRVEDAHTKGRVGNTDFGKGNESIRYFLIFFQCYFILFIRFFYFLWFGPRFTLTAAEKYRRTNEKVYKMV